MKTLLDASISDRRLLGGKAAALAALRRTGLPIPAWFVLASDAATVDHDEWNRALSAICLDGECLAVRSSAFDEDGNMYSFAGQFESFLFVAPEDVPEKAAAVRRSATAARVAGYSEARGARLSRRPPAVLIQRMVDADTAGVAFSADPVTGRRGTAVVSAVLGLGSSLVGGDVNADTWRIDFRGRAGRIVERDIAVKLTARRFIDGAIIEVPLSAEQAGRPSLTDEQVCAVARMARAAERHFGRPQDIEWAMEDGQLYLLQSRPITSIAEMADPDGARNLWDNSNITESYGGVTTPLTFSFARRAYEEVYRQFCRLLGVPESRIAAHAQTFRRMLGLVRGRVYYNLLNWYRVLALLPGFKINRQFMEQMMGVRESLPDELLTELAPPSPGERLKDIGHLFVMILALLVNHFLLPRRINAFRRRLDDALGEPQASLDAMRPDELAAHYRWLEERLLTRWDAPLLNDFFAMIFTGVLRRLSGKYLHDESLAGALLGGEGGVISVEPALRMREMARSAAANPEFARLLSDAPLEEILQALPRFADFAARYESYLGKFGDRCLDELKLESETLDDDPLPLLRTIGQLAEKLAEKPSANSKSDERDRGESQTRAAAEARMRAALRLHPLRRAIFAWTLKNARARIRERENLRFERTRLFGRVRRVFVELGRRFHAMDLLAEPRDIFYLEVEEALGFVEGTASATDLKSLVAVRQAEYARYREQATLAERFFTHGAVNHGNSFQAEQSQAAIDRHGDPVRQDLRRGLGCSPGVVRGRARIVRDPRNAALKPGEILVAERTDPGWILLFPVAAGLVVERGSMLSHAAIVSRELGLPAVVSIAGATEWLRTGDEVEIDGGAGVVRLLSSQQASKSEHTIFVHRNQPRRNEDLEERE